VKYHGPWHTPPSFSANIWPWKPTRDH